MYIVEALLLTVLLFTCLYSTVTEIKKGIIQNRTLLLSGSICFALNAIYYSCFARDFFKIFAIDFAILVVLSIAMYAFNLWAAGDSKLLFLVIFSIPGRFFDTDVGVGIAPAIFIIVFTFSISFIYIVIESIILRIKHKDRIENIKAKSSFLFKKLFILFRLYYCN